MSFEYWEVSVMIAVFGGMAVHHMASQTYFKTGISMKLKSVQRAENPSEFAFCVSGYSIVAVISLALLFMKLLHQ